jgi:hypothetical protein
LTAAPPGEQDNLLKAFVNTFSASCKGPWLSGLSLTQQSKSEALKPERLEEKTPSNSAFGFAATGFKNIGRHSGGGRNPVVLNFWTPASAGVTT